MIDYVGQFKAEKAENIRKMNEDPAVADAAKAFMEQTNKYLYGYNRTWMGRPIIQCPQDLQSLQEVIWDVKPDLIIETGIAHGGSVVFSASMLALLDASCPPPPQNIGREVVAIDIELRAHNRKALESHPMFPGIKIIDGDSTAPDVVARVKEIASRHNVIMALFDSNHTHDHVYAELSAYAPLITVGSYIVVFDTSVEFFESNSDRPWGKGNNPYTAVQQFLSECDHFAVDESFDKMSLITSNPKGWLKRIK